jgi:hypothetical protein
VRHSGAASWFLGAASAHNFTVGVSELGQLLAGAGDSSLRRASPWTTVSGATITSGTWPKSSNTFADCDAFNEIRNCGEGWGSLGLRHEARPWRRRSGRFLPWPSPLGGELALKCRSLDQRLRLNPRGAGSKMRLGRRSIIGRIGMR